MKSNKLTYYTSLVQAARIAKRNSYSPYSRFRVGAALLTNSGKIVTACNVESSSYGLTICAERAVLCKAISEGEKNFKAIAISSDSDEFTLPCGACRQVIMELAGDIDVVLVNTRGKNKVLKMNKLLPLPFDGKIFTQGKKKR